MKKLVCLFLSVVLMCTSVGVYASQNSFDPNIGI